MKTKIDPDAPWFGNQVDFEDRVKGLDLIHEEAAGKTVLDLGCSEGAISQWLLDAGATHATGIDNHISRINEGRESTKVHFQLANLNDLKTVPFLKKHDIVLCLAVLQKLRRPEVLLDYAMEHCGEFLAIRTPTSVIDDRRSYHRKLDVLRHVKSRGFILDRMITKPSWIAIFRCS